MRLYLDSRIVLILAFLGIFLTRNRYAKTVAIKLHAMIATHDVFTLRNQVTSTSRYQATVLDCSGTQQFDDLILSQNLSELRRSPNSSDQHRVPSIPNEFGHTNTPAEKSIRSLAESNLSAQVLPIRIT